MTKIKHCLFALVALTSALPSKAQTIDEVVYKYVNALGGKEKLASLKTVRMEGVIKTSGLPIDLIITKSHLNAQRIDLNVMGLNGYRINTPTSGWILMAFEGDNSPKPMNEDQIKAGEIYLDLQGPLFNHKEKGNLLELLGKEKVDNAECYKVKATLRSGKIFIYFIDTKSNFIVKSISPEDNNGVKYDVENFFSNYKATSNGYIFPFTIKNYREEQEFSKIEVNTPIDKNIFTVD